MSRDPRRLLITLWAAANRYVHFRAARSPVFDSDFSAWGAHSGTWQPRGQGRGGSGAQSHLTTLPRCPAGGGRGRGRGRGRLLRAPARAPVRPGATSLSPPRVVRLFRPFVRQSFLTLRNASTFFTT